MSNENHRQIYQELVARYEEFIKDDFTFIEGTDFTRKLNNEYHSRTGQFCSCFTTRITRHFQNQKTKRGKKEAKAKSQHEKLFSRLAAGDLAAEKGLAFSLLESGIRFEKSEIEMSYKAYWVGDCIVRAIVDEYGVMRSEKERQALCMNKEELKAAEDYLAQMETKNPKAHAEAVPQVTLTDFQIRDMLGKRLSNAEIYDLVKEFTSTA